MQPTTLAQTVADVESLNKPDQPFHYRVEGNQIIGEWKYLDANWAAPLAAGKVDKDFRVTVTLNETEHTYSSRDHLSQSGSSISFNSDEDVSFGHTSSNFSGHMIRKEFGFGMGKAKQPQNETAIGGPTYQYSFDTNTIKQPLFDFLAQHGWQKQKGFFGKLFGAK